MKNRIEKLLSIFFLLGIVFIPLSTLPNDLQYRFSHFLFQKPIAFLQNLIVSNPVQAVEFSSDTLAFNLLLFMLFAGAVFISFLIGSNKVIAFAKGVITFYLIYILLRYGIDKITGTQFYTPEPNILYSIFGTLDRDILFWSVTGLSKTYGIITGTIEVITALFLFFRRTRVIGLLLAVFLFLQILVINLSFDISVKTFSLFLLCASLYVLFPYLTPLKNIFVSEKSSRIKNPGIVFVKNRFLNQWIQFFLIGFFLIQILYPYFLSQKFPKTDFLHGAYEVTETIYKNDTLVPFNFPYRRFFFHKEQFFILQKTNNQMIDFHYKIFHRKNRLVLTDYQKNELNIDYQFKKNNTILELNIIKDSLQLKAKILDWENMPALRNDFHFIIEEIK